MAIEYAIREGKELSINASGGSERRWKALFELMGFQAAADAQKSRKKAGMAQTEAEVNDAPVKLR